MLKYNAARLVTRAVVLPSLSVRLAPERQYRAALIALLKAIAAAATASVIPHYASALTMDAATSSWFTQLRLTTTRLAGETAQTVGRVLKQEAIRHTEAFLALFRRAVGVDVSATVRPEDTDPYMQTSVDRNTSVIAGFADDIRQRIERVVYDASIARVAITTLKKRLTEEFIAAEKRARLIARNQTSRLNADLNRLRQEQAGITRYRWLTMHDERVRPLHNEIDGRIYRWGEETGAEQGLPPGYPVNCRCVARGIVGS
jgi:SPP1 gp7 family putative phage head morphogenesis protein